MELQPLGGMQCHQGDTILTRLFLIAFQDIHQRHACHQVFKRHLVFLFFYQGLRPSQQRALYRARTALIAGTLALAVFATFAVAMGVLYRRATRAEALATERLQDARRESHRALAVSAHLRSILLALNPVGPERPELTVRVDLGRGPASARVWSCDLSYDYVRINAEYRT